MKIRAIIRSIVKESSDENHHKKIYNIIEDIVSSWEINYNGSPLERCEINTGECHVFADNLISRLNRAGLRGAEMLDNDFFYDTATSEAKHDIEWADKFKSLKDYGSSKPKDFRFPDYGHHTWVYYNRKHYDADTPNGVENLFDLPLFRRFIKK